MPPVHHRQYALDGRNFCVCSCALTNYVRLGHEDETQRALASVHLPLPLDVNVQLYAPLRTIGLATCSGTRNSTISTKTLPGVWALEVRLAESCISSTLGCWFAIPQGIAHRDLKPENLLLDGQDRLKISDFGLSNLQRSGGSQATLLQTVCGTPNYVAPEVLKEKGYNGFTADLWSCGVILFVMLAGYLPFDDPNMNALFNKIERGEFRMAKWFSPEVKDLITKMLVVDPEKRYNLDDVIAHPWFRVGFDERRYQALKSGQIYNPSQSETNGAIRATEESDTPGSPTSGKSRGGPRTLDAFDMISRLTSGSLNPLVQQGGIVTRATRFIAVGTLDQLRAKTMEALQRARGNPKSDDGTEIKGYANTIKGPLTYTLDIIPTIAEGLSLVEIRRTRGDVLEFHEFYRQFTAFMGPAISR